MSKFKLVIAGGRDFEDYKFLKKKLLYFIGDKNMSDVTIVSGRAKGADALGERFAKEFGCNLKTFPADWDKHGKSAGFIRNAQMAKYADACIAFWDGESKGTKHMIDLANKEKIMLRVVEY